MQRSPDVGIGVRLQKVVPAPVVVPPPEPAPTGLFVASVSPSSINDTDEAWTFTVSLSQNFPTSKDYVFSLEAGTLLADVDYVSDPDSASFSEGVTCLLGVLSVPAGVDQFTITVAKVVPFADNPGYYRILISEGDLDVTGYGFGTLAIS